ncbi:MAG TPA: hypothetical protein VI981_05670 [Candidatus Paceibacterota bacterium]
MGVKDWLISSGMKQMLNQQLKNVPEAERQKLVSLVEKNPEFFMKIAGDIKAKVDAGTGEMTAAMEVMKENEAELCGMI